MGVSRETAYKVSRNGMYRPTLEAEQELGRGTRDPAFGLTPFVFRRH
jgi:hypothetical protein